MNTNNFLKQPVADVMIRDLCTLNPDDSLATAASLFLVEQISGAPVVNAKGECIGVLTATDVLAAADQEVRKQTAATDVFFARTDRVLDVEENGAQLARVRDKIAPYAEQTVADFMVTNVVAVRKSQTLETVMRDFLDAQIHRVLVVDEKGRLSGIVTTVDVIAAMLRVSSIDSLTCSSCAPT